MYLHSQESYVQELLARQMAASVSAPVFPGLSPHFPMYASTPAPQLPPMAQLQGSKDSVAPMPSSSEENQSSYVQHLQSESSAGGCIPQCLTISRLILMAPVGD